MNRLERPNGTIPLGITMCWKTNTTHAIVTGLRPHSLSKYHQCNCFIWIEKHNKWKLSMKMKEVSWKTMKRCAVNSFMEQLYAVEVSWPPFIRTESKRYAGLLYSFGCFQVAENDPQNFFQEFYLKFRQRKKFSVSINCSTPVSNVITSWDKWYAVCVMKCGNSASVEEGLPVSRPAFRSFPHGLSHGMINKSINQTQSQFF